MNQNNKELSHKYPPRQGHKAFINKLAKKQKYFDSADYQMALQTQEQGQAMGDGLQITGAVVPTQEAISANKSQLPRSPLVEPKPDSTLSSVSTKLEALEVGEHESH
ncbi:cAMP-regulated phosphoprotein 19-A-like [Drosophila miranda]|uniref:cAMP-regulated phosphoprotein 19-A-like n=1 Tax=Drosophila miranda TaxID=7229 RepID=UPI0007E6BBED|nr:cAMP-regulated phosphoprotein 19-A-like [Drosophila miranda]